MEKENAKHGKFEREWDPKLQRVSFNGQFLDHYTVQLSFVAGVLDMLYQIECYGNHQGELNTDMSFVILETKDKVKALQEEL